MRLLIILLSTLTGFTYTASADTALTQAAAQDLLEQWLSATSINCAVIIPIGDYNFPTSVAATGDQRKLIETVTAMKSIGAVERNDLQSTAGFVHFNVKLSRSVDMNQIAYFKGEPCIKFKVGDAPVKPTVTTIDFVKGKTTNWEGAIIYATSTDELTELYTAYRVAMNLPDISSRKLRYLFRYDSLQRAWQWTGQVDVAPLNGTFLAETVLDGLSAE